MALDPAGWLDAAQALPEGGRGRLQHTCGDGRVLIVDHKRGGWGAWCHRCNDRGWVPRPQESLTQRLDRLRETRAAESEVERSYDPPTPRNTDPSTWPLEARVWLYKAGIDNDQIKALGWYYHERTKRVVLTVKSGGRTVYWQARGFDPALPKYLNPPSGKAVFKHGSSSAPIVITEDILSSVRVGDSGVAQGWCIMGTSIPDRVLLDIMSSGKQCYVWLDPDAAGAKGAAKFVPKLRAYGVAVKRLTSEKDPKLHTLEEIRSVIRPDGASASPSS